VSASLAARALEFLQREGHYLDRREWDAWLALYREDAVFWVPAWMDEDHLGTDPDREVSLIYHSDRAALEDRVWRVRSQRSVASIPMLRTTHMIANVIAREGARPGTVAASASWTCHTYDPKLRRQHVFFGLYEFELNTAGADWTIARKKVLLQNDYIPTMIDFYCL
jgi:3-phenylpropionate/cinnamic acid dioxygenase small subunit